MVRLYHVSGAFLDVSTGDTIILRPGPQGAEGVGVYWAEGQPRPSAAEGAKGKPTIVFAINVSDSEGWWVTKAWRARKFGKPRTWHTNCKDIKLTVRSVGELDGLPVAYCDWEFA